MHWNYRVMYHENKDAPDDSYYAIHEVHYDEQGEPALYTEEATPVLWTEGFEGGVQVMDLMRKALEKPALTPEDFKGNQNDC